MIVAMPNPSQAGAADLDLPGRGRGDNYLDAYFGVTVVGKWAKPGKPGMSDYFIKALNVGLIKRIPARPNCPTTPREGVTRRLGLFSPL
jgi:hypothetical protein